MHPTVKIGAQIASKIASKIPDKTPAVDDANFFMTISAVRPAYPSRTENNSVPLRRGRRSRQCSGNSSAGSGPLLYQEKDRRHKEDSNEAGSQHPSDHRRAHDLAGHRTRA